MQGERFALVAGDEHAREVHIVSVGARRLVRNCDGVTRVYELIDVVSIPSGSRDVWRTVDVAAPLCEWDFAPRTGVTGEGRPSALCGPGTARVVEGFPRTLRAR